MQFVQERINTIIAGVNVKTLIMPHVTVLNNTACRLCQGGGLIRVPPHLKRDLYALEFHRSLNYTSCISNWIPAALKLGHLPCLETWSVSD